LTCSFLSFYIGIQLFTIDYVAAPPVKDIVFLEDGSGFMTWNEPYQFKNMAYTIIATYASNFITGTGIVVLSLLRLRLFLKNGRIMYSIMLIGVLSTIGRAALACFGYLKFLIVEYT
jgi:hypothetical protein